MATFAPLPVDGGTLRLTGVFGGSWSPGAGEYMRSALITIGYLPGHSDIAVFQAHDVTSPPTAESWSVVGGGVDYPQTSSVSRTGGNVAIHGPSGAPWIAGATVYVSWALSTQDTASPFNTHDYSGTFSFELTTPTPVVLNSIPSTARIGTPSTTDPVFAFTSVVEDDGGYDISIGVISGIWPDGFYRIHLGPTGTEADPLCYSGVGGQGSLIEARDQSAVFVSPPILGAAVHNVLVIGVEAPFRRLTPAAVTYVRRNLRSGIFAFRRILPPRFLTGPRAIRDVRT